MMKMRIIQLSILLLVSGAVQAQYWIGPKFGYHLTLNDYQDPEYKKDYRITKDHDFEAGIVVTYTATERYAVHGELYYEQVGNRVRNKENFYVDSQSTFRYLSFPILLRVSMGHTPVHWYLNGGPKLSLWLGGKGYLEYSDDESINIDGIERIDYKIGFDPSKADGISNGVFLVNEPNRIQYSLTVGGGFYLDLANGARVMVDGRFNWGHSNMGFNLGVDEDGASKAILVGSANNIPVAGYQENYEYSHTNLSVSVAYMFEYNTQLKRKGGSTVDASNKNKKAVKKKKK